MRKLYSILFVSILAVAVAITGARHVHAQTSSSTIQISDVFGLQQALNIRPPMCADFDPNTTAAIEAAGCIGGVVGNPDDYVLVNGTSTSASTNGQSSGTQVDGEVPSGVMNSTNATFTLANTPNPSSSLHLYQNGLRLSPSVDYTIANNTITFIAAIPQASDHIVADYRF